jgi:hypothetical protein
MSDADKIQILTAALQRIAKREGAPEIHASASFSYKDGVDHAIEWATGEASFALKQILDSGESEDGWACFECNDGTIWRACKPYETTGGKGEPLTIPDVPTWTCDHCGAESFCANGSRIIEEARIAAGVKYRR